MTCVAAAPPSPTFSPNSSAMERTSCSSRSPIAVETIISSTMVCRDEYLLKHRRALIASPAAVEAFLARVRSLSLDLHELRVGWSADADELECGIAIRFLFLAMKHLIEEDRKPSDPKKAEEAMVARAVKLVQEALEYRQANSIGVYCAAAVAVWDDMVPSSRGGAEIGEISNATDQALVTEKHREQISLILQGLFQPCGTTDAGIPMIMLRLGEALAKVGAVFVPTAPAEGSGVVSDVTGLFTSVVSGATTEATNIGSDVGGYLSSFFTEEAPKAPASKPPQTTYPDTEFTPALVGITDSVFKGACAAESVRAGRVVDRVTVLVDCKDLDVWKLTEVRRLTMAFFNILREVTPETLEAVYMVDVGSVMSRPVEVLMQLFTDEDSGRRLKFVDAQELGPLIGKANIPAALLAGVPRAPVPQRRT